jgi:hypothetical protein
MYLYEKHIKVLGGKTSPQITLTDCNSNSLPHPSRDTPKSLPHPSRDTPKSLQVCTIEDFIELLSL